MPKQYKQKTTPRNMALLHSKKYSLNRWLDKWLFKPLIGACGIALCIVCFMLYKGNERAIKQQQINKQQGYGMDKR